MREDLPLVGRTEELAHVMALIGGLPDRGGALLVRGEPGIGKSSLLREAGASAAAAGLRVLSTTGVQSEASLPFAGLHQLLWPIIDRADRLPAPQRAALRTAFGMEESATPDRFLIALAAFEVLCDIGAEAPLVLLVDDLQWLDEPTAEVLAFVARRLDSAPVAALFAARDGDDRSLPVLELAVLDPRASEGLLDVHGSHLSAFAREQVLNQAAGNPLALVELPSVHGAGGALPAGILPVTTRLEQAFGHRVASLPPQTAAALLLVAANDGESLDEAQAAGATLDALAPAVDARLITLDGPRVTFRHPLMRSTVYQQAGEAARRVAHAELALALDDAPDRRAWHRAATRTGPDEGIACDLEAAATRAQRRGAISVAALALRRAIDLSTDPASLGRRLMAAATLAFEMGENDEVVRLLDAAEPLLVDDGLREQAALSRDQYQRGVLSSAANPNRSVQVAMVAWGGDSTLAMSILRMSAIRCWWSGFDRPARQALADALDRLGVPADDPAGLVVRSVTDPVGLQPGAEPRLRRVLHGRGNDPVAARMVAIAAYTAGEFDVAASALAIAIPAFRAQHRLAVLTHMLGFRAAIAAHTGDWVAAAADATEAEQLAARTEQPVWQAQARVSQALVAAARGEQDASEGLLTLAERDALPTACRGVLAQVQLARGWSALGAGRHDEAFDHLVAIFDEQGSAGHYTVQCWAIGDLAEAAVGGDHRSELPEQIAKVMALAGAEPSPRTRVALSYAQALLADDETRYLEAIETATPTWPFANARARLAYGKWLRRHRRVSEASVAQTAAASAFEALEARPWAQQARDGTDSWGELTSKELQIARLAATGLSNREIGQRLYLSHRTVGTHLSRSFRKLGIHNRSQLHAALQAPPDVRR